MLKRCLLLLVIFTSVLILSGCKKKVEVIFETNGGSSIETITDPDKVNFKALPTTSKTGHTFKGWYIDAELTKPIEDNAPEKYKEITLYAKWEINSYTIHFVANGGSEVADAAHAYGATITEPVTALIGYTFDGWYTDEALQSRFIFTTMPANDITLYAKWILNEYTIIFQENGGDSIPDITQGYNTAVTEPIPERVGYRFAGWYEDQALSNAYTFGLMPLNGKTLYAKWAINTYTISFISNAEISVTSITAEYNKPITKPDDPIRQGYSFQGWFEDADLTKPYVFTTMPAEDKTLYAKWQAGNATISFNADGGTSVAPITAPVGSTLTKPADPTKDGYTFGGWYEDALLTKAYTITTMPVEDITLHARWIPNDYTITFQVNGGSTVDPITASYGDEVTSPADPIKEGFVFDGWYADEGLTIRYSFSTMPKDNITLYAGWLEANQAMLINHVKTVQTLTLVIVEGIVFSRLIDSYTGFYIYDATGAILISYDQSMVAIGDRVCITGRYDVWNGIPLINNVSEMTIISNGNPSCDPEVSDISAISTISPQEADNYGRMFTLEGILVFNSGYYYLSDINGNLIRISHMSFDYREGGATGIMSDPFEAYLGSKVTMDLILEEYDYEEGLWAGSFVGGTIESLTMTDQEKLDIIVGNFHDLYETKVFRPHEVFDLPATDVFHWSEISYSATGANASLYDATTLQFAMCTGANVVDFDLSITINSVAYEEVLSLTVDFTESSIAQLVNGDENIEYVIKGMVVQTLSDFDGYIIWDGFDYLMLSYCETELKIGDGVYVVAHPGYYPAEIDMGDPSNRLYLIPDYLPVPHAAENVTLTELGLSDLEDRRSFFRLVETRGYIAYDSEEGLFSLTANETTLWVMPGSLTAYELLQNYVGMEVIISATTVPIGEELALIFFGYREGILIPEYTDEELVNVLQKMIIDQYQQTDFKPFDTFDLWPYHPLLGGNVTWSFAEASQPYYDEANKKFIYVEETVPIQINVTITNNAAVLAFTLTTELKPLEFLTADIMDGSPVASFGYLDGIVVYHSLDCTYLKSNNDLFRINGYLPAYKGDHIMVKVYLDYYDNHPTLYIESEDYYFEVKTKNNPYELIPEEMTLEEVSSHDAYSQDFYHDYIRVTGTLNEAGYSIELTDGVHRIGLDACDGYTFDRLKQYIGREITICGYAEAVTGGVDGNRIWTLFYTGLDGELEPVTYTDAQQLARIKADLLTTYQKTSHVGDTYLDFIASHPVFASSITFVAKGENASYVNIAEDYLSEVTSVTEVTLEVTITVGALTETFDITLTITPQETAGIVITSIADFKQSEGETLVIRGIVVYWAYSYIIIQDATDRILVRVALSSGDANLYKLVEVTGNLEKEYGRCEVKMAYFKEIAQNQTVSVAYPEATIHDLINADIYDETKHLQAVTIRGTLRKDSLSNMLYLTDGYDKVFMSYDGAYFNILYRYLGYNVAFRCFTYGLNEDAIRDGWYVAPLSSSIALDGYTDGELIDFAGNAVVDEYDGMIYNCFGYLMFSLPYDLVSGATVTYQVLDDPEQVLDIESGRINFTTETKDFTIQLTITKGSTTKTFTFTITVIGMSLNNVSGVASPIGELYEEINMVGAFFHAADGTKYFLVGDEIFVLNDNYDEDGYFDDGDMVLISGIKSISNNVGGYGYEITFNNLNYGSYDPVELDFYPIDMVSLYNPATDKNFLTTKYLELTGQLLYDKVMGMYYLKNGEHIVYIRCGMAEEMTLMSYDRGGRGEYSWYLEEYLYADVSIRVLFPNLKVRGGVYLVDFKELENAITLCDLTPYEIVTLIKQRMIDELDGREFYGGDYYDFYGSMSPYYPDIFYAFDQPLWSGGYFSWVNTEKDLTITVTVSYTGEVTSEITFTLHMTIKPAEITPIEDVLRGNLYDEFYIEGVVQFMDTLWNNFLIIQDDTGSIMVEMYDVAGVVVGDKVIIKGNVQFNSSMIYFADGSLVEITANLQGVTTTGQPTTIDDIEKTDYYHQPDLLTLVTVTGVIQMVSPYDFQLVSEDRVLDIVFIQTEDVDSLAVLDTLIGQQVTMTGYLLGINSIYDETNWKITFFGEIPFCQIIY